MLILDSVVPRLPGMTAKLVVVMLIKHHEDYTAALATCTKLL
jgi:hypothetical protein